jgi:opacity protein-like surface antigen
MKSTLLVAGAALAVFAAAAARAAPPPSVGGTTWTVQANRAAAQLVITQQGGPGDTAGTECPQIFGTIGADPIYGWYCWDVGRIHFLHNNPASGATYRVFTGNVSDDVIGQPTYMGGTVTVVDPLFGANGEHNYSALK